MITRCRIIGVALSLFTCNCTPPATAQGPVVRYGAKVPQDVRTVYARGLNYLAQTQAENGSWPSGYGKGITGICVLAFLANGEDPNFGPHSLVVRRAIRSIIETRIPAPATYPTACIATGLACSLWPRRTAPSTSRNCGRWGRLRGKRSIGAALELAVRAAVTAQKHNQVGGWRYSPKDNSADTSVSGAVLVGLLAARNAGIEVPDPCMDRALEYYRNSTSDDGTVAYSGGMGGMGESMNRSSIATLVYAIGKRKNWREYEATLNYVRSRLEHQERGYPFYFRYYMSQALFQGDLNAWTRWKQENVRTLKELQLEDGSFQGGHGGPQYATAMALLSLALDYRFLPIYER